MKCCLFAADVESNRRSPSWGAWIEMPTTGAPSPKYSVAPPRGERGLKLPSLLGCPCLVCGRSPSWGAWIEIYRPWATYTKCPAGRSPSWGAWIEIIFAQRIIQGKIERRSPSWGAWIEILGHWVIFGLLNVAPPRGERGLKLFQIQMKI